MNIYISEYKTAGASNPSLLDVEVNALIKNGWQPLGSQTATGEGIGRYHTQAMVKYAETRDPKMGPM